MPGMALTGASSVAGNVSGASALAGGASGALPGLGFAMKGIGAVLGGLEAFGQAMEFQRQNQAEINILQNNTEMVLIAEKQAKRDIDIRAGVMSGEITASAGSRGVSASSASVVNAASLVIARSKVDKLRLSIQAQNQIELNRFKEAELKRQNSQMMRKAAVSTATGFIKAFAPF